MQIVTFCMVPHLPDVMFFSKYLCNRVRVIFCGHSCRNGLFACHHYFESKRCWLCSDYHCTLHMSPYSASNTVLILLHRQTAEANAKRNENGCAAHDPATSIHFLGLLNEEIYDLDIPFSKHIIIEPGCTNTRSR